MRERGLIKVRGGSVFAVCIRGLFVVCVRGLFTVRIKNWTDRTGPTKKNWTETIGPGGSETAWEHARETPKGPMDLPE